MIGRLIRENAKALVGALVAGLGSLRQALDNSGVSGQESIDIIMAALGALGFVWVVPNALRGSTPRPLEPRRDDAQHAARRTSAL